MPDRKVDYLLIGGGLAAANCARWLRESGADGAVMLVGREPDPPYNRPNCSKGYLRGEEMREDRAREIAERILRDQKFRKAPLTNPRHLAGAVQLWSQQKGRTPMRERIQTIETDVRSGGPSFSTVSEMVQQYPAPYTTQEIARRMLDALEKEVEKKR